MNNSYNYCGLDTITEETGTERTENISNEAHPVCIDEALLQKLIYRPSNMFFKPGAQDE